jgi:hypothetical protein
MTNNTGGFLNYLLAQGLPLSEASQYLYMAPAYSNGQEPTEENMRALASTIYANHFSNAANNVNMQGLRTGVGPFNPVGTQPTGTAPRDFNISYVTESPIVTSGLLGTINPKFPTATLPSAPSPNVAGGATNGAGTTNGSGGAGGAYVLPTQPFNGGGATVPRVSPPATPAVTQPFVNNGTGNGAVPPNANVQPWASGAYSAPWQMGGAWSGVTSFPQYGNGLLGGATQSGQSSVIDRAKDSAKDVYPINPAYEGAGLGAGGGGNGFGGTSVTLPNEGVFTLPSAPDYQSRQFLQTYNNQPAPYANEHQQMFDAMRGVQPLVPTFRNYLSGRAAPASGTAGQQQVGGLLATGGNYFPGFK